MNPCEGEWGDGYSPSLEVNTFQRDEGFKDTSEIRGGKKRSACLDYGSMILKSFFHLTVHIYTVCGEMYDFSRGADTTSLSCYEPRGCCTSEALTVEPTRHNFRQINTKIYRRHKAWTLREWIFIRVCYSVSGPSCFASEMPQIFAVSASRYCFSVPPNPINAMHFACNEATFCWLACASFSEEDARAGIKLH